MPYVNKPAKPGSYEAQQKSVRIIAGTNGEALIVQTFEFIDPKTGEKTEASYVMNGFSLRE